MKTLLTTQPVLHQQSQRLESILGIGKQTAVQLAALFSRVTLTVSQLFSEENQSLRITLLVYVRLYNIHLE